MESDAQLVERCRSGDRDAFATLIHRYEYVVRASTIRIVQDRHLSDDVVQEAFIAAYKSLPKLRVASKFGPWLLGIARRQAVRSTRGRKYPVVLHEVDAAPVDDRWLPEDSMALLEVVNRLGDDERTLIGLRHFQGYSVKEIAEVTSRPVGTVTKQLSRVHRKLKLWLVEEHSND